MMCMTPREWLEARAESLARMDLEREGAEAGIVVDDGAGMRRARAIAAMLADEPRVLAVLEAAAKLGPDDCSAWLGPWDCLSRDEANPCDPCRTRAAVAALGEGLMPVEGGAP